MPPRLAVEDVSVAGLAGPVDFSVAAGDCLGLSGPSGAGKTLLLRAIADLTPHDGICRLDGETAVAFAPDAWRRRVTYVAGESAWWHETVNPHMAGVTDADLAGLGFPPEVRAWSVARLSAGERQRLALLRSLALRPDVLLLDEPTANLDGHNTEHVERLLGDDRRDRGTAMVWVAHDDAQLERVANRRARLDGDGRFTCD